MNMAVNSSHFAIRKTGKAARVSAGMQDIALSSIATEEFDLAFHDGKAAKVSLKDVLAEIWNRVTVSRQWDVFYTSKYRLAEDGSIVSGHIMRRREGGVVLYRAMTSAEQAECGWDQAIQI